MPVVKQAATNFTITEYHAFSKIEAQSEIRALAVISCGRKNKRYFGILAAFKASLDDKRLVKNMQ